MNAAGTQWVSGKIGEWLQGTDKSGDPIVYPLTTTSSPFRTVTWIEPAANLSIVIKSPQSPNSKRKTELAVNEMAVACGFATECGYRITIWNSPPSRRTAVSNELEAMGAAYGSVVRSSHKRGFSRAIATLMICRRLVTLDKQNRGAIKSQNAES
jgi:hypothetical protein